MSKEASRDNGDLDSLVRPVSLRDQVYDRVRSFLRESNIRPGDRLREQILADRLGVSRTPVREALLRLAQEELVVPAGRGFEVPRISEPDFANLFELRRALEPRAFASVAESGSVDDMLKVLARSRAAHESKNVAAFARANAGFREAWFAQVKNPRLVSAIRLYDDYFLHLRRFTHESVSVREIMLAGHLELARTVADRDSKAAAIAMNRNLDEAEKAMRAVLHRQGE
jgi:DNA-binding GntR family transcriptional regulator